jgi:hypothetical protein
VTDDPGGAKALRRVAPFGFRYQYLAGGVNTGNGWATWNPNGAFASAYVHESWAQRQVPVLSYYMLLQSKPGGGDEAHADLTNLRDPATMTAYWRDVRLLFSRTAGTKPVAFHVEPDLRPYAAAGVVAFMFGRGADGATCACDAAKDGVTDPAPVNGNTRASLSADDDGGYFKAQARAYYRAGAITLPR